MSTNPFASPSEHASYQPPVPPGDDTFVKQIPIVGIFMIVEGVMELLYGLFMTGFAFVFPVMLANDPNFKKQMDPNMPFGPETFLFALYFAMGCGPLIAGIVRTISGVLVVQRRARTFAITANILGFLAITGCYCIPTGLAASIYALVVLLQTPVAMAFAQRAAEREAAKNAASFSPNKKY
jgi:hypothetical protein